MVEKPQPARGRCSRYMLTVSVLLSWLLAVSACTGDAEWVPADDADVAVSPDAGDVDDATDASDLTDAGDSARDAQPDPVPDSADSPLGGDVPDARDVGSEADADGAEPPPRPEISTGRLATLRDALTTALDADSVAGRQLTALVVEAEGGRELYASAPDLALVPASNTKLFTTATAFALLGEGYRFRTRIYAAAAPDESGVIEGDLTVISEHDFTFSADFYASARFPFDQMAAELYEMGVRQISGTLRLAGELGYDAYHFAEYDPEAHRQAGVAALAAALDAVGIGVGMTETGAGFEPPAGSVVLAEWRSVPLSVACSPLNRISHNEYADLLMRHLGYVFEGTSSYAAGAAQVEDWLAGNGVDTTGFTLSDGSGLSYANRVSARHVVALFQLMQRAPFGESWLHTLSVAGVRGTLAGRLTGADTRGRVFGKTGTLNIAIATSGVLVNRYDGRRYLFSFIMNDQPDAGAARAAHDAGVVALAGDLLQRGERPPAPALSFVLSQGDGDHLSAAWEAADSAEGYFVWRSPDGTVWARGDALYTTDVIHIWREESSGPPVYVRLTSVNAAGESDPSDVYAARAAAGPSGLLIVDGNERWQSGPVPENTLGGSHAFVVDTAEVVGGTAGFDTASNRAVAAATPSIDDYAAVIWGVGEESTADESLDDVEQRLLADYAQGGGNLFLSGSEIGWDLVERGAPADSAFYATVLRAQYVGDDANSYVIEGSGGIFADLPLMSFYTPDEMVVAYPDQLAPLGGSLEALTYVGGHGGAAGLQYDGDYRLVYLGFPFESIDSAEDRAWVMSRVLDFFEIDVP